MDDTNETPKKRPRGNPNWKKQPNGYGQPQIDYPKMIKEYLEGATMVELAKKYNCTPPTISRYVKRYRDEIASRIVFDGDQRSKRPSERRAVLDDMVDHEIDAMAQLRKINYTANTIMDLAAGYNGLDQKIADLIIQTIEINGGQHPTAKEIAELVRQVCGDNTLLLKTCAEIRQQIELQLNVFSTFYSVKAIADFQEIVLDAINSCDPALHDRVITELVRRRALGRSALEISRRGSAIG